MSHKILKLTITIKKTNPITIGAITLPINSPNKTQILFNGDNSFEFINPSIRNIREIIKDQILGSPKLINGHKPISKNTTKKSIPKILLEEILFFI